MMEPVVERRVCERAFLGAYLGAGLAAVVIGAICFTLAPWLVPAAVLPVLGVFAYARLMRLGSSYRLFPDRLEIESGLLGRKIENVQLFRVRDVGLSQGLFGRMANYGDIHIHSTDSSSPDLNLRAIDAPREFYQQLRDQVAGARRQNRALYVEDGGMEEPSG